jgi:hypothetical protein
MAPAAAGKRFQWNSATNGNFYRSICRLKANKKGRARAGIAERPCLIAFRRGPSPFKENVFDFGMAIAHDGEPFVGLYHKFFAAGASRAVPVLDIVSSNWSVDSAIVTHIFPFPSCEP